MSKRDQSKFFDRLLTVALAPFALLIFIPVLLFFGCLLVLNLPSSLWEDQKWKRALKQRGRLRNPQTRKSEIRNGTLIVDSYTLGCGAARCWWTEDKIKTIAPMPEASDSEREQRLKDETDFLETPFDRWTYERYLDPDHGTAILMSTRRGDRFAKKMADRHPEVAVVTVWSAAVIANDFEREFERPDEVPLDS